jgi:hypothetical protein
MLFMHKEARRAPPARRPSRARVACITWLQLHTCVAGKLATLAASLRRSCPAPEAPQQRARPPKRRLLRVLLNRESFVLEIKHPRVIKDIQCVAHARVLGQWPLGVAAAVPAPLGLLQGSGRPRQPRRLRCEMCRRQSPRRLPAACRSGPAPWRCRIARPLPARRGGGRRGGERGPRRRQAARVDAVLVALECVADGAVQLMCAIGICCTGTLNVFPTQSST